MKNENVKKLETLLTLKNRESYLLIHVEIHALLLSKIITEINLEKEFNEKTESLFNETLTLLLDLKKSGEYIRTKLNYYNFIYKSFYQFLNNVNDLYLKTFLDKNQEIALKLLRFVELRTYDNFEYIFRETILNLPDNSISIFPNYDFDSKITVHQLSVPLIGYKEPFNVGNENMLFLIAFRTNLSTVALKKVKKEDLIQIKRAITEVKYISAMPNTPYFGFYRIANRWFSNMFSNITTGDENRFDNTDSPIRVISLDNPNEQLDDNKEYSLLFCLESKKVLLKRKNLKSLKNFKYYLDLLKEAGQSYKVEKNVKFSAFLLERSQPKINQFMVKKEKPLIKGEANSWIDSLLIENKRLLKIESIKEKLKTSLFLKPKRKSIKAVDVFIEKECSDREGSENKTEPYYNIEEFASSVENIKNTELIIDFLNENKEFYDKENGFITDDGYEIFNLENKM